ncbi:DUF6146 family protein [Gaetbulibacter aestuarii]|uniref:DUF6146 family protein n=1 Tax=Gaetbulibacter aestuarii TaxID=1502358 RepID=A0ABW7N1S1_9FLAO
MKYLLYSVIVCLFLAGCHSTKPTVLKSQDEQVANTTQNDTVKIENKDEDYEIIIIDPGFNTFLYGSAKPRGFHNQTYLENRNRIYVTEWNRRVLQPQVYNPNLYEMQINYDPQIDYGYEVNYLLYNYFIYFQLKYKQRLGPYTPRI